MNIWYGLDRVPQDLSGRGTVVTIGVFDGVHRGHQTLVNAAVEEAQRRGVPSVMFTFDPHPTVVFRPESVPALLAPVEERARLAIEMGIDHVVVIGFTKEIASWSPEQYVDEVLVNRLGAKAVYVGDNFTFGHKAAGKPADLERLGAERGIDVHVLSLLQEGEQTICSTYIREQLAEGKIENANQALGRPFSVRGEVTHGAGRGGRALGFPTANLYFQDKYALPADGVYAGYLIVESGDEGNPELGESTQVGTMPLGERMPAAISVGTNPTFGHEPRSVESFVLDHEADLYGLNVTVEFLHRLRGMETYNSLDELIEAINRDVAQTRGVLEGK
ncbi:bifunctional riboflavin kinase/FAD synthetase [Corynebacterium suicordis]|uniref:Riboflavin biosynthesis protein n=1 Tax=Corynebacterium suicordis DSM 45110 TaxID=1121369 RepID=A0ABR9ZJ68_9CORY|nr:bifunctional riboflavin kinase/FAD synthetase [Corynebacterium suicordis]MBF4553440.1 bifunctional riboflavin kinase/FAD synthetase [Corynebacterium suicordis DSM 45110]MDR6277586.1 riboflavin kinase/FMN adenylyltransferase [Corynebacterium suicordis]